VVAGRARGRPSRDKEGSYVSSRWAFVGAIVITLSSPVGAQPLEREHYSFQESDTFTDTDCGAPITIDYLAEFSGLFMLKQGRAGDPTPYLFDNYAGVDTFTNVANGLTATVTHQGLYKDVRIEQVEGTIYEFTAIETGRPVVAIGPDGKMLVFDSGRIRYSFVVDTKGDADLSNEEFLVDFEPDVAGPHLIFFGEADFCDLLDLLR
jgi:hypothetical protein